MCLRPNVSLWHIMGIMEKKERISGSVVACDWNRSNCSSRAPAAPSAPAPPIHHCCLLLAPPPASAHRGSCPTQPAALLRMAMARFRIGYPRVSGLGVQVWGLFLTHDFWVRARNLSGSVLGLVFHRGCPMDNRLE